MGKTVDAAKASKPTKAPDFSSGKPLEGIRVLDLSHLLPGPFCTMVLADLGAEVIKIENPKGGDGFRTRKPLLREEGTAFLMLNRNKKSVVIDLKTQEGKEFFFKMAKSADVVLEQFRPGTVEKLGIDYKSLYPLNPELIYCSLSGYGQTGQYSQMPGHDINYLSLSGVLDAIGAEGQAPVVPSIQIADIGGGAQWAIIAILTALFGRSVTGQGQYIDVSMTHCMLPWLSLFLSQYAVDGTVPERGATKGSGHFACYRIYETSDAKFVSLGAAEPKFWARFCEIIERTDLIEDQYAEGDRRLELIKTLEQIFKSQTREYWSGLLLEAEVCFTPVLNFGEAVNSEFWASSGLVGSYSHPTEGEVLNIGHPLKFSGFATDAITPAPILGADTAHYLQDVDK